MKKFSSVYLTLVIALLFTFPCFAVNEDSSEYMAGYDDGFADAYDERDFEVESSYDSGYYDGYKSAEEDYEYSIEESYDKGYAAAVKEAEDEDDSFFFATIALYSLIILAFIVYAIYTAIISKVKNRKTEDDFYFDLIKVIFSFIVIASHCLVFYQLSKTTIPSFIVAIWGFISYLTICKLKKEIKELRSCSK